jgi:alpha-N-arabinofuranosidase
MPEYALGAVAVPQVSATSAISSGGELLLAVVNLHAEESVDLSVSIRGFDAAAATGRVLTGRAIDAHNTFDDKEAVAPVALDVRLDRLTLSGELPPRSVSVITLRR